MNTSSKGDTTSAGSVRTRFAPSPTGFLHVGGVRTALFAWLVARQGNGQFILRLEDTDQAREVQGSGQHIMDSLRWLGLEWDEGPDIGGNYGPYIQSKRLDSYTPWAHKLIESGRAYADPYSVEEVNAFREEAKTAKRPFLFRDHRPSKTPAWDGNQPLRFKAEPKDYTWHDAVMGELHAGEEAIDDFILIKSDGFPTYNFAHIIDDVEMDITHVIRSQEFISSIPRYLNLYEALGIKSPTLATLPFVMGPDGKKKLSKRDGAKDILDYARQGFMPEALLNFLASLGWNDGTTQELFTPKELIEKFRLDHVQKSGARFDEQRLLWMNGAHIRQHTVDELFGQVKDFWPPEAKTYDDAYKKQVLGAVQDRLKYFAELPQLTRFFFVDLPPDNALIEQNKAVAVLLPQERYDLLKQSRKQLASSDFSHEDLTKVLNELLELTNQKPAVLFSLIRIATTQAVASPGLVDTLAILGKDKSLARIDTQLTTTHIT